jgi:hypothetical protein
LICRISPIDWVHAVTVCNVYEYEIMPKQTVSARMKATRKRCRPRKRRTDEVAEGLKIMGKRNWQTVATGLREWMKTIGNEDP